MYLTLKLIVNILFLSFLVSATPVDPRAISLRDLTNNHETLDNAGLLFGADLQ